MTIHLAQGSAAGAVLPPAPVTFGAPVWNGAAWESDLPAAVDLCSEFGVSTSNADNSTAINAALAALGPLGLVAFISKPGAYAIKNPIIIGNGSSSAFATWSGMLAGAGYGPGGPNVTGLNAGTVQTMLQWTGAAGLTDAMVQFVGPVIGGGLRNLRIDGGTSANAPGWAIHTKSLARGELTNIAVANCQSGIWHDSYAAVSGALAGIIVNDIFNQCRNISISFIGKAAAHNFGLLFDGGANGVSNACFTEYNGAWFSGPSSSLGGATNDNLYFKRCDSIIVRNATMDNQSGSDSHRQIVFDWGSVAQWPKGCLVDKIDLGTTSAGTIVSNGTPATGAIMGHNSIINISTANGQPPNPNIPWLKWGDNAYVGTATLVAGAATVANTAVGASSQIQVSILQPGTLANVGTPYVNTRTAGTGFTIASTNASDTSTILYRIVTDGDGY